MRALACAALLAAGCFDFDGLSSGLGDLGEPTDLEDNADLADGAIASDLAPPDLADADLAPLPCPLDAIACESFEDASLPAGWSAEASVGSSVAVMFGGGHTGLGRLVAQGGGTTNAYARVYYTLSPALTSGKLYVRFWARAVTANDYPLYCIVPATNYTLAVGVGANDTWIMSLVDGTQDTDTVSLFAQSTWSCVRFSIDLDAGSAQLAIDAAPITQATGPQATGPIAQIQFGLARAPGSASTAVDIDDIAISLLPLACD